MRFAAAVLVLVLVVGCGTGRSTGVEAVARDAGDVAASPPASQPYAGDCPDAGLSMTCAPIGHDDGGFRYGCYAGSCPVGDAGVCTVTSDDPVTRYAEVVCERPACTRVASPGDSQCGDAGLAWQCPIHRGKTLADAPGRCDVWVAPSSESTGVMYCCR